jgi:hypothetical protein
VTENFENFCEFPKRPKAARTEPGWGICREQIQPDREYLCVFVHYTTTFNQQLTAVAKSH